MAERKPQTFDNHVRIIPTYHGVVFGIFAINLLWSLYRAATSFSWEALLALLLAVALLFLSFHARLMALTVQDRVIRLEMRLRLERLLPADLRNRFDELTVDQFVSLRFAGDGEIVDLTRKVLDERLTDRKAIKRMIRDWQGDYLRA